MLIFRLYLLLLICPVLLPLLHPRSAQATPQSPVSEPIAPIIFIGHPPQNHYVILIPSPQDDLVRSHLARIRDKMSSTGQIPFVARNRLGHYIYAGSFTERSQAENTRQRLLNDEPRARVVYFPD
jgi:cell division protein FtsN